MQTVIIDTDIAIDYLRGISYAKEVILPLWDKNTAYMSTLSVYELYAGIREKEREDTENFITACNIELVTLEIAKQGGKTYQNYRKKGITLTAIDCLIHATAIRKNHKILTKNIDHYPDKAILLPLK